MRFQEALIFSSRRSPEKCMKACLVTAKAPSPSVAISWPKAMSRYCMRQSAAHRSGPDPVRTVLPPSHWRT
jgi:hypothetical protein